jgi:hypothetical protein
MSQRGLSTDLVERKENKRQRHGASGPSKVLIKRRALMRHRRESRAHEAAFHNHAYNLALRPEAQRIQGQVSEVLDPVLGIATKGVASLIGGYAAEGQNLPASQVKFIFEGILRDGSDLTSPFIPLYSEFTLKLTTMHSALDWARRCIRTVQKPWEPSRGYGFYLHDHEVYPEDNALGLTPRSTWGDFEYDPAVGVSHTVRVQTQALPLPRGHDLSDSE